FVWSPHATPPTTAFSRTTRPTAANQTGSQNNGNHSALVPVKPRGRKPKRIVHKQLDIPDICDRLTSSVACEEILYCEEVKNQAISEIDALYDEIRPAIEEHKRDSQDSVSTSLAEKWIEASCRKYKAEFDLYAAVLKNIASTPLRSKDDVAPRVQNGLKWVPPPLSSNRSPERENESTFAAGRSRIVELIFFILDALTCAHGFIITGSYFAERTSSVEAATQEEDLFMYPDVATEVCTVILSFPGRLLLLETT
ncbi:hypothetical protein ACJX0J_005629, partial [Zea mays]